jgi:hypothetical protein
MLTPNGELQLKNTEQIVVLEDKKQEKIKEIYDE